MVIGSKFYRAMDWQTWLAVSQVSGAVAIGRSMQRRVSSGLQAFDTAALAASRILANSSQPR
jgi:hypothetical protein